MPFARKNEGLVGTRLDAGRAGAARVHVPTLTRTICAGCVQQLHPAIAARVRLIRKANACARHYPVPAGAAALMRSSIPNLSSVPTSRIRMRRQVQATASPASDGSEMPPIYPPAAAHANNMLQKAEAYLSAADDHLPAPLPQPVGSCRFPSVA